MPQPNGLRSRVMLLYEEGYSISAISERLMIPRSTVREWILRSEQDFNEDHPPRGHRPQILDEDERAYIIDLLTSRNDLYLREIQVIVSEELEKHVSISTLWRMLQREDYSHKKLTTISSRRDPESRAIFQEMMSQLPGEACVWLDEVGYSYSARLRKWGWSKRGLYQLFFFSVLHH